MPFARNAALEKLSISGRLAAVAMLLLLATAFAPVNSFAQQIYTETYLPSAYGTYAFVGNTTLVGQTGPASLGGMCGTSEYPFTASGTAAAVSLPPVVTGGAVNTSVSDSYNQAQANANTGSVSLLGGLITAQQITAVSTTNMDDNFNFTVSAAGSNFNSLVVLGHVYNGSVPANTQINLPLLGYVVLNEQTPNFGTYGASLTVNMIHVYITVGNLLGLQVGTQVIVSSASSGMYNIPTPTVLSGGSYGTQVSGTVLASLASSPTAPEYLPCLGTNGVVETNSQVGLTLPSVLSAGTLVDTVESNLVYTGSSGENTSTIQNLNLLNGLVTASLLRGQVDASVDFSLNYSLSGQDSYVGIAVAGHPEITDDIPDNTSVPLAGLGTLYLKRIIYTDAYPIYTVEVRSLELQVNQTNLYGLPVGLDVIVGDTNITVVLPTMQPM
jgi:hypothetical protein